MAVQVGSLKIRGTIAGICFYRMYGRYYARKKSSLTGKRVKRDAVFAKTMYYAVLLGKASQIASKRYKRMVPKEERSRKKYRELVGKVMLELREEKFLSQRTSGVRKYNGGLLCNTGRGQELHKFAPINIVATEARSRREEKVGHRGTELQRGKGWPRITQIYTDGDCQEWQRFTRIVEIPNYRQLKEQIICVPVFV